jgi:hypothetical protein
MHILVFGVEVSNFGAFCGADFRLASVIAQLNAPVGVLREAV